MTTDTINEVPEIDTDAVQEIDHTLYVLRDLVFLKGQEITEKNGWCGTAYDAMGEMGIRGVSPVNPQDLPVGTVVFTIGYTHTVYIKKDANSWEGTSSNGFTRGTITYPERVRVPLTDEQMSDVNFVVSFRPDGDYAEKAVSPESTNPKDYILKSVVRRIALRYARAHTTRDQEIVHSALTELAIEAELIQTAEVLPVTSVVSYRTRYNEHYTLVKVGLDKWESTSHEVFDSSGVPTGDYTPRVEMTDSDVNAYRYYVVFNPQGIYQD